MNRRFINTYIKYTAKKPILFFMMIGTFLFSILFISLTTKTNLVKSYSGTMVGNSIIIDTEIKTIPYKIYAYSNKNEAVYMINIRNVERQNNKTVLFIGNYTELPDLISAHNIYIDIPQNEISLFERVFLRGSKIND